MDKPEKKERKRKDIHINEGTNRTKYDNTDCSLF